MVVRIEEVIAIYVKDLEVKLAWYELHLKQFKYDFLPEFWNFVAALKNVPSHLKRHEIEYFTNFHLQATFHLMAYETYALRYKVFVAQFRRFVGSIREQCQLLWQL
jgi:hypothetical protein